MGTKEIVEFAINALSTVLHHHAIHDGQQPYQMIVRNLAEDVSHHREGEPEAAFFRKLAEAIQILTEGDAEEGGAEEGPAPQELRAGQTSEEAARGGPSGGPALLTSWARAASSGVQAGDRPRGASAPT